MVDGCVAAEGVLGVMGATGAAMDTCAGMSPTRCLSWSRAVCSGSLSCSMSAPLSKSSTDGLGQRLSADSCCSCSCRKHRNDRRTSLGPSVPSIWELEAEREAVVVAAAGEGA